jgi:hypothetical protein
MKRIFFLMTGLLSLTLCSFMAKKSNGVTRIGEHLFNVKPAAVFTPAEAADLKKAVMSYYSIADMGTCPGGNITLKACGGDDCGGSAVSTSFANDVLSDNATKWDCAAVAQDNPNIAVIDRVLSRYADGQ